MLEKMVEAFRALLAEAKEKGLTGEAVDNAARELERYDEVREREKAQWG